MTWPATVRRLVPFELVCAEAAWPPAETVGYRVSQDDGRGRVAATLVPLVSLAAGCGDPRPGTVNRPGRRELTQRASGEDWFRIAIRPLRERSYWISQSRNVPMPEPSYDKPG